MYGLVNRGLKEFIEYSASESTWRQIAGQVGLGDEPFVDLQQYPDELAYDIVGAACEALGSPADAFLRAFGRHWILFTAESAYGDLMSSSSGLYEFLENLDRLHVSVAKSMPKLVPPNFGVEEIEAGWVVLYVSERSGLEPMVEGLLEGLLETFAVDGTVKQIADSSYGEKRFLISRSSD